MESNDDANATGLIAPLNAAARAAQLAHNLQNLLMIMGRCVDSIRGQLPAGSSVEDELAELDRSIDRTFHLTQQLLALGRPASGGRAVVDVNQLVRNAAGMLERALASSTTPRYQLGATSPHALINPYELEWVLLSLIIHFREVMPKGGGLAIATTTETRCVGDRSRAIVRLTVAQTSSEAPEEPLDRPVPTPWDASDIPASRLRNIANLVESLGGWLEVVHQAGRATTVQVDLPVAYSSSER